MPEHQSLRARCVQVYSGQQALHTGGVQPPSPSSMRSALNFNDGSSPTSGMSSSPGSSPTTLLRRVSSYGSVGSDAPSTASGHTQRRARRRMSISHTTHTSGMQDRKTLRRTGELYTQATLRVMSHMLDTIGAAEELKGGSITASASVRDPSSPGVAFLNQSAIAERMGGSPKFLDSTSTSLKTVFAAVQECDTAAAADADLVVPDMDGDTAAMLLSLQENASKIAAKLAVQVSCPYMALSS